MLLANTATDLAPQGRVGEEILFNIYILAKPKSGAPDCKINHKGNRGVVFLGSETQK